MKKIRILVSVFAVIIIAMLIIPSFINWSQYQQKGQKILKDKTGYDIRVGGDLRLALLPTPRMKVNDVTVFVEGFEDQPVVKLGHASVLLNPLALIHQRINISSVLVEDTVINMFVDANGKKNWEATAPSADKQTADTPETSEQNGAEANDNLAAKIQVDAIELENVAFVYKDAAANSEQRIVLETLDLNAESLSGPFEVDGVAQYNQDRFDIKAQSGAYKAGEATPISFSLSNDKQDFLLGFSGTMQAAHLSQPAQAEGSFSFKAENLMSLLQRYAGNAAPQWAGGVGFIELKGSMSAQQDFLRLSNSYIQVNDRKADVDFDVSGLTKDLITLSTSIRFRDVFNADEFVRLIKTERPQTQGNNKAENKNETAAPQDIGSLSLLPARIELPKNVKLNMQVSMPGVAYNNQRTGQVVFSGSYDEGKLSLDLDALNMPGETSLKTRGALEYQNVERSGLKYILSKPQFKTDIDATTKNIKGFVSEWLGIVDVAALPDDMPNVFLMRSGLIVQGALARLNLKDVNLGQTKLSGTVSYEKRASRPKIMMDVQGGLFSVPDFSKMRSDSAQGAASQTGQSPSSAARSLSIPSLPFDADVKLALDRLDYGDVSIRGLKTDLSYAEPKLSITRLEVANYQGASLGAKGAISDLQALQGVDLTLRTKTDDIDTVLAAHNITLPEAVPSPIGALDASVSVKGNLDKSNIAASLKAYGFSLQAKAVKEDLLSASLPGAMSVKLTHPNTAKAMRFVSPSYRAQNKLMNSPLSLSSNITVQGQSYNLQDLNLKFGPTTFTGSAAYNAGGAKPVLNANVTADQLPINILMGKEASTQSAGRSSSSSSSAQGGSPWTREAINTDGLRALNADVKLKAGVLSYDNTVLRNASADVSLNNGVLQMRNIRGEMDKGTLEGNITVSAKQARAPIDLTADIALINATMSSATKALLGRSSKRMQGDLAFKMAVQSSGISSAALVNALNGQGNFQLTDPSLQGFDAKAIYNSFRSLDSLGSGVLSMLDRSTQSGSTQFNSVDKTFEIKNGRVDVNNWDMKTDQVTLMSNGKVDLANWLIDLQNKVSFEGLSAVPDLGMRVYGPLHAPQTTFLDQALEDFVVQKYGNKVQNVIKDKLISDGVQDKLKDKLGVGLDDLLPFAGNPQPSSQQDQSTGQQEQPAQDQADPTQQIMRGIFNQFTR